jgi:hypothetical protein
VNTRFLGGLDAPVKVETLNLLVDEIEPGAFDLVHGRAVLMHLREPESVLTKMVAGVKPGGWICIEEGDYEVFSAVDLDDPEGRAWTEQWQAAFRKMRDADVMDAWFGRRVRGLLVGLGLEQVVADGVTDIWRGGEPGPRFCELTSAVFRAGGFTDEEEHNRTVRLMNDPTFLFKDKILFGAWGRKPT